MYTTIEADIKNGRIQSAEALQIPAEAHVLITVLSEKPHALSVPARSMRGAFRHYADSQRVAEEQAAWGQAAEQKHETD